MESNAVPCAPACAALTPPLRGRLFGMAGNNPLHKTPKLDMARSIIDEWTGLDANSDRLLANATA